MMEWTKHWDADGALADAGMIPMGEDERAKFKKAMSDLPCLSWMTYQNRVVKLGFWFKLKGPCSLSRVPFDLFGDFYFHFCSDSTGNHSDQHFVRICDVPFGLF